MNIQVKNIIIAGCVTAAVATAAVFIMPRINIGADTGKNEILSPKPRIISEEESAASDLSGLSVEEKAAMGLRVEDGSDTDGDGLTDKEEVEIYHTDPLKRSTAGDMYTDGEKIQLGMDPLVYAERDGYTPEFPNNQCPEIQFSADNADNLLAEAEDVTGTYNYKNYEVLKAYRISKYEGDITIDAGKALQGEEDLSKLKIMKGDWTGQTFNNAEISKDGFLYTVKNAAERRDGIYIILLVKSGGKKAPSEQSDGSFVMGESTQNKGTAKNNITGLVNKGKEMFGLDDGNDEAELGGCGMVYCAYIFQLLGARPVMYYVPTNDPEKDARYEQYLVDVATSYRDSMFGQDSVDNIKLITYDEYKAKKKMLDLFPAETFHHTKAEDCKGLGLLFTYAYLTDYTSYMPSEETNEENPKEPHSSGFNPRTDILPFKNFTTEHIPGYCAGMSLLSARYFKYGSADAEGEYGVEGQNISWNLLGDEENESKLLKRDSSNDDIMYYYKTPEFFDGKTDDDGNVETEKFSQGEQQFFNMLACYQYMANNVQPLRSTYHQDDFACIESAMKSIDSGNPVIIGITSEQTKKSKETGENETVTGYHAVVAFKYYYNKKEGQVKFCIYDCNHPGNGKNVSDYQELIVTKYKDETGKERFKYYYKYPGCALYTNDASMKKANDWWFSMTDADLNPLC